MGFSTIFLAAFALAVAALGGIATGASAQTEVGTLTIYKTECPPGYAGDDFYGDCYGNPVEGLQFSAEQGKSGEAPVVVATVASGFATLPLFGGVTIVREGLPAGIADYFVFCTNDGGETLVEFEYTGDTFGILLDEEGGDYAPGDDLRCDWYNVPAGDGGQSPAAGSVSIYRATCPAGYDGTSYTDYYDDCVGNPAAGAHFVIRQDGTDVAAGFSTGPDGNTSTTLPLSAPGTVVVTETPAAGGEPLPYQDYVVFCIRNGSEELPVDYGQPGVMDIVFDAAPEDAIGCDWFHVPPAGPDDGADDEPQGETTLTIYATACPEGYQGADYFADCYGNPVDGLEFVAYRLKEDLFIRGVTDADGFATLTIPPSDFYDGISFNQSPNVEVPGGGDPPFAVICTDEDGESVDVGYGLLQLDPGGDAYTAEINQLPSGDVRCDWYLLSASDGGDDDAIDGTLTIYVTACPPGYDGGDYYPDCYDEPQASVTFAASGRIGVIPEDATNELGFVSFTFAEIGVFEPVEAGEHEAGISIGIETAADFAVFCTKNGGTAVDVFSLDGGPAGLPGVGIPGADVEPGDDIRCDWYLLTAAAPGDDDDTGRQPVTVLPNTGAGMGVGQGRYSAPLVAGLLALVSMAAGAASFVCRR